jgi:hypothetical protein
LKRLRPFFKRYGTKYRLAPKYPAPKCSLIVEPFAGAAQYSLLYWKQPVLLAETDPDIFCLWNWLITEAQPKDILALPIELTPGIDIRSLPITYPAQILIRQWQRVGRCGSWTVSKWNNANSGLWSVSTRNAIAKQLACIRHWRIYLNADLLFDALHSCNCTWFIDPPYEQQATIYGTEPLNYTALANTIQGLQGQIIVCEMPGANWLPFKALAENTVGRTHQGGTRPKRLEMLYYHEHFIY